MMTWVAVVAGVAAGAGRTVNGRMMAAKVAGAGAAADHGWVQHAWASAGEIG
jgi:hypothetical protein